MLSSQVKKFEQESEELQARAVEVQRQREVLERRIADLEIDAAKKSHYITQLCDFDNGAMPTHSPCAT